MQHNSYVLCTQFEQMRNEAIYAITNINQNLGHFRTWHIHWSTNHPLYLRCTFLVNYKHKRTNYAFHSLLHYLLMEIGER